MLCSTGTLSLQSSDAIARLRSSHAVADAEGRSDGSRRRRPAVVRGAGAGARK
jgi:hypothetical protein